MHVDLIFPFAFQSAQSGASQVIDKQCRELSQSGYDVIHLPIQQQSSRQSTRVILRSLFLRSSSAEEFHYPSHLYPSLSAEAEWQIFHYSFAWNLLQRMPSLRTLRHPRPHRVVVFHNLESDLYLRRAKQELFRRPWLTPFFLLNAWKLYRHEAELSEMVDEIWFISPVDQHEYTRRLRGPSTAKICFRPPRFSSEDFGKWGEPTLFPVYGLIGDYTFAPNRDGLIWLIENVFPALKRKNFSGIIRIAGKGLDQELCRKLDFFSFVRVLGFIEKEADFWRGLSLMLVPHLHGSGVRIKSLESLAYGIPVLTHPEAGGRLDPNVRIEAKQKQALLESQDSKGWVEQMLASTERLRIAKHIMSSGVGISSIYFDKTPSSL